MREFGELLRTHRIGAGLTQQQLADFAMVSVRAIRDLECGRTRSPRAETVRLLADGLRLDEDSRAELQLAGGRSSSRAAVAPPAPAGPGGLIVGREAEAAALAAMLMEGRGGAGAGAGAAELADGPGRGVGAVGAGQAGVADGLGRTGGGVGTGQAGGAEGQGRVGGDVGPGRTGGVVGAADGRGSGVGPRQVWDAAGPVSGRQDEDPAGSVGERARTTAEGHPRAIGAAPADGGHRLANGTGAVAAEVGHQHVSGAAAAPLNAGHQAVWNTSAPSAVADGEARGRTGTLTTPFEPSRLITITGVSGVGKTRLALEVAGDLHFRHGWSVLWHPSHATPAVDDEQDTVLVTDHRPDPRLLEAHPRLRVVVTALAPTGLPGEHVFPLGALDDDAAVRLLLTHVHRVRPAFKPEPANQAALAGLVHALDGLPSALEFAAGWFMVYSPQHLLERLRSHPLDPTSAHLRDSLRRSLSTMDDEARALLVRMAEGEEAGHGRALQELRVRGLVRRAGERYEVLSLVRAAVLEPVSGPHLHGSVALTWPV